MIYYYVCVYLLFAILMLIFLIKETKKAGAGYLGTDVYIMVGLAWPAVLVMRLVIVIYNFIDKKLKEVYDK